MRGEFPRFQRNADFAQDPLDPAVQPLQHAIAANAGPQRSRASLIPEVPDAAQRQFERRQFDFSQGQVDIARLGAVDFADEAQGQVKLLNAAPLRAGDTMAQRRQALFDVGGQFYGDEQAWHGGSRIVAVAARLFRRQRL
jgi:hypothetical protein